MYSKALRGYEKAVGADDSRSRSLQDNLSSLDAMTGNGSLIDIREPARKKRCTGCCRNSIEIKTA
jgi:hypothetical protein